MPLGLTNLAMLLSAVATLFSFSPARADTVQDQDARRVANLHEIENAAPQFCGSFFTGGSSSRVTLDASAQAKIAGLAKLFSDADASIGGSYTSDHYESVLQHELASSNATVATCRTNLLKELKFMIPTSPAKPSELSPPIPPMACGNSIFYYHPGNTRQYIPQSVWTCKDERIPTPVKLTDAASRALVEEQHGQLETTVGTDKIEWPVVKGRIYTIGLKNTGKSTVYIESMKLVGGDLARFHSTIKFFPQKFVVRPDETILVPVALLKDLGPLLDPQFNDTVYRYNASNDANWNCSTEVAPVPNSMNSCESHSMGFGVSIDFVDGFGQKSAFNALGFLDRWREDS